MQYTQMVAFIIFSFFITGCINIQFIEKNSIPSFLQVALVTPTLLEPTITYTKTPRSPSETPSPSATYAPSSTLTGSPTLTQTKTQIVSSIRGVLRTNSKCRNGPDIVYDVAFYLAKDIELTIIGRNSDNTWLVMEPDSGDECWINSKLVDVKDNIDSLQIVEAPPTPIQAILTHTVKPTKKPQGNESTPSPAPPYP